MKPGLTSFVAGVVFALGLGLGGMTDPQKVQAFLDISGQWNPSLAFVMAGALSTHALLRRRILRRMRPVFAAQFQPATHTRIEPRLVVGAAFFGVGWGLVGYCPGPAFTSVATLTPQALLFVAAMMAGMVLHAAVERFTAPIPEVAPR